MEPPEMETPPGTALSKLMMLAPGAAALKEAAAADELVICAKLETYTISH
jgi:hypothetical protein